MAGITDFRISDVPVAVVDVETTGLHPNGDRIIEIAIIRVDPGTGPRVVLDTLINPQRPVSATEIHGITDADVKDAPTFREIAPAISAAMTGCVFASFNVYFDAKFVSSELQRSGISSFPPHICLMYLRPGLGIGKRCTLADACAAQGISHSHAHFAADDAMASSELWLGYIHRMTELEIHTYGELAARMSYKFVQSFSDPLLNVAIIDGRTFRFRPRRIDRADTEPSRAAAQARINPIAEYWDALKTCLADLTVTSTEMEYLIGKRKEVQLSDAQVRSLHARAFAGLLAQMSDDHAIDEEEVSKIAALADGLRTLGWRPGDPIAGTVEAKQPSILQRILR